MNEREAARLVLSALAACPAQATRINAQLQDAMVITWRTLLDDLSYEQCNAALTVMLQTKPFLPAPAEIRATVQELLNGPTRPGGEAWGSVVRAMKAKGSHRRPGVDFVFNDPITAECVTAFGWPELCASENQVADRARFIELYDQLASQARREQTVPALAAARETRANSIASREVAQIGDAVKHVLRLVPGADEEQAR